MHPASTLAADIAPMTAPSDGDATRTGTAFDRCVAAKHRFIGALMLVFLVDYFGLIWGAGHARALFATPLFGDVTIGVVAAIAQYPLVALLAMLYAWRMRGFDAELKALARAGDRR